MVKEEYVQIVADDEGRGTDVDSFAEIMKIPR